MDPSPCSAAALDYATLLAEHLGASVDVLHVHEHGQFKVGSSVPIAPEALRQAEQQMDQTVSMASARLGERLRRRTETGDPLRRIVEVAAEGKYDIVVMGTHGRLGRLHMLVGSVTEGVVRNAPCPVLTVRVPDGEESFAERIHGAAPLSEQLPGKQ
jgi:nucleotide-binding universal stress UspA family protein